jgi:cytolysin (calcineurin-like family phosphatase)
MQNSGALYPMFDRRNLTQKAFITGLTILGATLSIGLHSQIGLAQTATKDFSMIIGSDTQYPWTARTDAGDKTETYKEREAGSAVANINHITSMNKLVLQTGNVKGMILNGDITEHGHPEQLDKHRGFWQKLSVPIYVGLGNHDYHNNVSDCYQNRCAVGMVEYARDEIRKRSPLSFDYRETKSYDYPDMVTEGIGSLAYSWDTGNVHFVQLNNYPLYETNFSGFITGNPIRKRMRIQNSLDWLEADLIKARNAGKAIVLNYHDPSGHWAESYTSEVYESRKARFIKMLKTYHVSAVFVGHLHGRIGRTTDKNLVNMYGSVPVFFSGSASQGKYLLAKFNNNQMTIEQISSKNGEVIRTTDGSYSLDTRIPNPPISMPTNKAGSITFFNQGGYVARYSLSYVLNGTVRFSNGDNLSLGNKQLFELPAAATNILVRGEVNTGLKWKEIFNQSIDHPHAPLCFKSYGTTGNPQWNNSCT